MAQYINSFDIDKAPILLTDNITFKAWPAVVAVKASLPY